MARFDGGCITSDGGGLLREVERRTGILRRFAACFTDHREPGLTTRRARGLDTHPAHWGAFVAVGDWR